jgi:hypothetical protein
MSFNFYTEVFGSFNSRMYLFPLLNCMKPHDLADMTSIRITNIKCYQIDQMKTENLLYYEILSNMCTTITLGIQISISC